MTSEQAQFIREISVVVFLIAALWPTGLVVEARKHGRALDTMALKVVIAGAMALVTAVLLRMVMT